MLRLTTLGDLAQAIGGVPRDESLVVSEGTLAEPVTVQGLHAERVELTSLLAAGQLVLRGCRMDRLVLDHCAVGSLLLVGCRIGRLEIRNAISIRSIALADCELSSALLHGVGDTRLNQVSVATRTVVSGLRASLHLRMLTGAELLISGQLSAAPDQITMTVADSTLTSDLAVRDVEVANLRIRECRIGGSAILHRTTVAAELHVVRLRCGGRFVLDGVTCGSPVVIRGCELADGMNALRLAQARPTPSGGRPVAAVAARIEGSTVAGPLSVVVSTPSDRIVLADTSVTGQLRFPPASARYHLVGATAVADVELTAWPIRTVRAAEELVAERFAQSGVTELATMRTALGLRGRSGEEDLLYYLQRRAEARIMPGPRGWWARLVLGGVLGWGVRLRAPIRALATGVATTAVAIYLTGMLRAAGDGFWSWAAAGRCVGLAAALWFNVGTGLPNDVDGGGWTAVSDASAAFGLVLLTVLVGVAIRKLVR